MRRTRCRSTGIRDSSDCEAWDALFAGAFDPTKASNCNLPQSEVYDPKTNPRGVRCTIQDYLVSVSGRRPRAIRGPVEKKIGHGFGQLPLDTVGVQYGLRALKAGTISPAQFADLNAKIGAIDDRRRAHAEAPARPSRPASRPSTAPA